MKGITPQLLNNTSVRLCFTLKKIKPGQNAVYHTLWMHHMAYTTWPGMWSAACAIYNFIWIICIRHKTCADVPPFFVDLRPKTNCRWVTGSGLMRSGPEPIGMWYVVLVQLGSALLFQPYDRKLLSTYVRRSDRNSAEGEILGYASVGRSLCVGTMEAGLLFPVCLSHSHHLYM